MHARCSFCGAASDFAPISRFQASEGKMLSVA
jgi:hypothetical protein